MTARSFRWFIVTYLFAGQIWLGVGMGIRIYRCPQEEQPRAATLALAVPLWPTYLIASIVSRNGGRPETPCEIGKP